MCQLIVKIADAIDEDLEEEMGLEEEKEEKEQDAMDEEEQDAKQPAKDEEEEEEEQVSKQPAKDGDSASQSLFTVSDDTMDVIKEYVALQAGFLGMSVDDYLETKKEEALAKSVLLATQGTPKDADAVLRDDIMFMIRERGREQVEKASKRAGERSEARTKPASEFRGNLFKSKPSDSPDLLKDSRNLNQRDLRKKRREKKLQAARLKGPSGSNPGDGSGEGQGDADSNAES
jgi:hypothetical protein